MAACMPEQEMQIGNIFIIIWLIGAVGQVILFIEKNCSYSRYLLPFRLRNDDRLPGTRMTVREILLQEEQTFGNIYTSPCALLRMIMKTGNDPIEIYLLPGNRSPAAVGVFVRKIALPDREYTDQQLRYILMHEMYHIKNGDLRLKLFLQLLKCIQWYNPLVSKLEEMMIRIYENRTDREVISCLSAKEGMEYYEMLLRYEASVRTECGRNGIRGKNHFLNRGSRLKDSRWNTPEWKFRKKELGVLVILLFGI